MEIALKDFLMIGTVGPIHIGSTKEEVTACFGIGENENFSSPKRRGKTKFITWQYNCLEFGFNFNNVILIGFYFRNESGFPSRLKIIDFDLNSGTNIEKLWKYLQENAISCFLDLDYTSDSYLCLRVGVGVGVYFLKNNRRLDSLQFIGESRAKSNLKQVRDLSEIFRFD